MASFVIVSEWRQLDAHEFLFHDSPLSRYEAHARCREFGGHLASVTSKSESRFLNQFTYPKYSDFFSCLLLLMLLLFVTMLIAL